MRVHGRIDGNQVEIVRSLRALGMSVMVMSDLGGGKPDIAVGAHGQNFFVELKSHSRVKLTDDEKEFHSTWRGQVCIAETVEDILDAVEASGASVAVQRFKTSAKRPMTIDQWNEKSFKAHKAQKDAPNLLSYDYVMVHGTPQAKAEMQARWDAAHAPSADKGKLHGGSL